MRVHNGGAQLVVTSIKAATTDALGLAGILFIIPASMPAAPAVRSLSSAYSLSLLPSPSPPASPSVDSESEYPAADEVRSSHLIV